MSNKIIGVVLTACLALTGLAITPVAAAPSTPVLVKDLVTTGAGSYPDSFVSHEGILYFSAYDAVKGYELFAQNLTTGATVVFDVNPIGHSWPNSLTLDTAADLLYFGGQIEGKQFLFKLTISTGTVSTIYEYPCQAWYPWETGDLGTLKVWQGDLYFYACNADTEFSLWKYETGTSPSKISFPELLPQGRNTYTYKFTMAEYAGSLYFAIGGNSEIGHIAVTDGSTAHYVEQLTSFNQIRGMIVFDGVLIFGGAPNGAYDDVYQFDGTNVSYVDQINDGCCIVNASGFTIVNNKLYFSAYTADPSSDGNKRLFELDANGNIRLLELGQLRSGTSPYSIQGFDGSVYFIGFDDSSNRNWVYVYNGTSVLKVEDSPQIPWFGMEQSNRALIAVGSTLYFVGQFENRDAELWSFNGSNPPSVYKNLNLGTDSSWQNGLGVFKGSMYWVTGGEEQYSSTMWKLDEQNVPVKIAGLDNSEISNFSILSSGIYFWKSTDGVGRQPWVLTGTGLPRKFADVEGGNDWGWSDFTELNGKIFAVAAERLIVMSSNGTVTYEPSGVSGVQDIVKVGSYMYFTGWSDADGKGTEIYRWNGTGAAELAADVMVGSSSSSSTELVSFNSKLYFIAEDGTESNNTAESVDRSRFLYSLGLDGTLTKLSDLTCSWNCDTDNYLEQMQAVGSNLFANARTTIGNKILLKLNKNTNTFAPIKRNGADIVGAGSFATVNAITTVGSFVDGVGCTVHRINDDGSLTDLFSSLDDNCLYNYSWSPVADFSGNLYFPYFSGGFGEELHMLAGVGTPTKPGKISKLALAKNGATKSSLKMSWKAPALNGGKAVTNYKVEYSLNGKKWTVFKHKVSKAASIVITKLKKKTKYFVRVSAITSKGTGAVTTVRVSTK
jgi:ELWxxDGT repeat protein